MNDDQHDAMLPESILEMARWYHSPSQIPRDRIWKGVRTELHTLGLVRSPNPIQRDTAAPGIVRNLVRRRVPHVLIGYIAGSWGLLQFTDYVVDNFVLSTDWNRIALTSVILLVPSILLLAYYHGSPGKDRLSPVEKIGVPLNLAVALAIVVAIFRGEELGALVTPVSIVDEAGNITERRAVKEGLQRRVVWFPFDLRGGMDEEDSWMSYLIPDAISLDLAANDFFDHLTPFAQVGAERLRRAGYDDFRNVPLSLKLEVGQRLGANHVFEGEVSRGENGYRLDTRLYEAATGGLLNERSYQGPNLLALVDQLTADAPGDIDLPERRDIENLPVSEYYSTDSTTLAAFGRGGLEAPFVQGDYTTAIDELSVATAADPTFAYAQYSLALILLNANRGPEARARIELAIENLHRVPTRFQYLVRSDYYRLNMDFERSRRVIEDWSTLYPNDRLALQRLVAVQDQRGNLPGMLATLEKLGRLSPEDGPLLQRIAGLHERMGNDAAALAAREEYVERFPDDWSGLSALAGHHSARGNLELARQHLERALLLAPTEISLVRAVANLDLREGRFELARSGYERALASAVTSLEKVASGSALLTYHRYRGEINRGLEVLQAAIAEGAPRDRPVALLEEAVRNIPFYLDAGRVAEARASLDLLRRELQPNMVADLRLAELEIAVWEGDPERAQAALARADSAFLARAPQGGLLSQFTWQKALVAELREDWSTALEVHRSRLQQSPNDYSIRIDIGRVQRRLGQLFEAEAEIRRALRAYPSSPLAHTELARVLVARADSAGARDHLRRALIAWENPDQAYRPAREARELLVELTP